MGRDDFQPTSVGQGSKSSASLPKGLGFPPHLPPLDSRVQWTYWKDGGLESPIPLVLSGGKQGNGGGGGTSSVRGSWARGAISDWGLSDDTS
jgi:hypothetical protein